LTTNLKCREDHPMDPITVIVSAIALGASTGLKDAAATTIKDAHASLKHLITGKYPQVDVTPVENKPDSKPKRGSLEEDLVDAGAEHDEELMKAAQRVIAAVKAHAAAAGPAVGIDLERVDAAALRICSVESESTGVRVLDGKFTGDIDIGEVRAGGSGSNRP
jgi:hypothetical protein